MLMLVFTDRIKNLLKKIWNNYLKSHTFVCSLSRGVVKGTH